MSYSAKSTGVPLNELVSMTSQPTSRKAEWTFSTASGLRHQQIFITTFEAQPSEVVQSKVLNLQIGPHRAIEDHDAFF